MIINKTRFTQHQLQALHTMKERKTDNSNKHKVLENLNCQEVDQLVIYLHIQVKDFFFIDRSTFYVMCRWLNLQKMKSNENFKKWTFLPVHVSPSPSNPGRQVHSYEPLMFKQNALSSQGLVEHSSISNEEQI